MGIDVDGMTWRDVAKCDQACAQRGLAISGALDGNGLQETVLGGGRGQQGEAGEQPAVGAADRIDSAHAGGIAENRLKDES